MSGPLKFDASDLMLLRWQLVLFISCSLVATGIYLGINTIEEQASRDLRRAESSFQRAKSSVELIEEEEATIVENIDEYKQLAAHGIFKIEDRLQFLEDIAVIRDELNLFPVNLSIAEQFNASLEYPVGTNPGGSIDLKSSEISLSMPLLHEEDFIRFLAAVASNGGLFQVKECALSLRNSGAKSFITLQQHMSVACSAVWYTFDLAPAIEQPALLGGGRGFL